ncbi:bifunctional nuclease family protein [bacterium]|nr:bifunctional nuclease family protein [bacterium]
MNEERRAQVYTIMMVPVTGQFVVLLEEIDGTRLLPIWIGRSEGESILIKLQNIDLPRPITHDLFVNVLSSFKATVQKVLISDLHDNTYYAEITLMHNNKPLVIDARPSDGIAIALRAGADLFIAQKVFEKCPVVSKPISQKEVDDFKSKLETLNPKDFFQDLGNIDIENS